MNRYLTPIFCLILSIGQGQSTKGLTPVAKGNSVNSGITRAVVVGISDYQNENITNLQFADKDARIYADYLVSSAGMGIDSGNVTVLLNEQATAGNFVSALYGLIEESKEGDLAIIYFSGHGDVESNTISQPGFLLCWDAPARVYMGGGTFGLAYLQDIISTLSLTTKTKVLVIMDACRSGKLAGNSVGGTQATAANLSKQYANETKILSCQPDEFALEGKSWGDGRGVFSYYLLAGLQGLADVNENGEVSLTEIERYLEDQVSSAVSPHSQMPLTIGSKTNVVSMVNPEVLRKLKELDMEAGDLSQLGVRSIEIDNIDISDTTILRKYREFNFALKSKNLLEPSDHCAWTLFHEIKDADDLKSHAGLMRRNLAAALQDDAQQAINAYLAADMKELRKRERFDVNYQKYEESLDKAAELLGSDHFYYKALKSRYYYFKGLNLRVKGEQNQESRLYEQARFYQDSCIGLDSTAAFAWNEKGWESHLLKSYDEALHYYEKTIELTPNWPLVWSNKSAAQLRLKRKDEALISAKKALEIDSLFAYGINQIGRVYRDLDSIDIAIDYFKKGIQIDSDMVELYTNLILLDLKVGKNAEAAKYAMKLEEMNTTSIMKFQTLIEYHFYSGDLNGAFEQLVQYTTQYPDDNYAYYLMASINVANSEVEQCFINLEKAFQKGFQSFETIEKDKAFKEVINTAEYLALKKKYSVRE